MKNKNTSQLKAVANLKEVVSAGASSGNRQITKEDYVDLLLLKERRIESLEQKMAELANDRKILQKSCATQLEVIEELKARLVNVHTKTDSNSAAQYVAQMPQAAKESIQLNDTPVLNKEEFLSVDVTPPVTSIEQTGRWIMKGLVKAMF